VLIRNESRAFALARRAYPKWHIPSPSCPGSLIPRSKHPRARDFDTLWRAGQGFAGAAASRERRGCARSSNETGTNYAGANSPSASSRSNECRKSIGLFVRRSCRSCGS